METLFIALFVYSVVITILFFVTARRMESSNDEALTEIKQALSNIKPEKVRVEIDTSPWSLDKSNPVEEDQALYEMWEALNKRGFVGDNVERIGHLFGWEQYNRAPLSDGRIIVWYGNSTPSHIRNLVNQNNKEIDIDESPLPVLFAG